MHSSYFDISLEIKILLVMCDIYANGIVLYVRGKWSTKVWNQKKFLFSLLEITCLGIFEPRSSHQFVTFCNIRDFPFLVTISKKIEMVFKPELILCLLI
jgi:hypothetical protein